LIINFHKLIESDFIFGEFKRQYHCTSKFCGFDLISDHIKDYLNKPTVALNIGKVFQLEIIAFTFTERTFGKLY
jgi:hypothetical protein